MGLRNRCWPVPLTWTSIRPDRSMAQRHRRAVQRQGLSFVVTGRLPGVIGLDRPSGGAGQTRQHSGLGPAGLAAFGIGAVDMVRVGERFWQTLFDRRRSPSTRRCGAQSSDASTFSSDAACPRTDDAVSVSSGLPFSVSSYWGPMVVSPCGLTG